jgi:hypothetical protein
MSARVQVLAFSMILLAALTACGGGGGGGGVREVPFTSFDAVTPNQTVVMSGISTRASGTLTIFPGGGGFAVDTFNFSFVEDSNTTARLTYDGSGGLSGMGFSTPGSSASFGQGQINCTSGAVCVGGNSTSVGLAVDAFAFGWNYQSFGAWLNLLSPTTFQVGAMSAGAVTPASAVPGSETATFGGFASGFYVDSVGVPYVTAANMSAVVDFGMERIAFSTTDTTIGNLNTGATPIRSSGLDISGNLTRTPGSAQFTGTVSSQDTTLFGTATARFYGPAAEELGGVYALGGSGGNPSRMIGAFGARRL